MAINVQKILKTANLDKSFLRFLLVGIFNTIVGTGIMFIAYNCFGMSYWISSALNYIVGSMLSFFLNKYFTFHSHSSTLKSAIRFIINILLCYLIAYSVAKPFMVLMLTEASKTIQENVAMLLGMVLFVILNYMGQRFFVFKAKSNSEYD